jgi:hypothetical protein
MKTKLKATRKIRLAALFGLVLTFAGFPRAYGENTRHLFFEMTSASGDPVVRLLSILDQQSGEGYGYRVSGDVLRGSLIRHLSSGLAVVAKDEGEYASVWIAQVSGNNIALTEMEGVEALNKKTIDVREGDSASFHLAWITPDKRAIRYAHVDPFADKCCIAVAAYRAKESLDLPPSFYLSNHVLVGRERVGIVQTEKRGDNPETKLSMFEVDSVGGAIRQLTSSNQITPSSKRSEISVAIADLASNFGMGGLRKISGDITIGSHLQPEAEHSWYGGTYIALAHHLNEDMSSLDLKLIALLDDDRGSEEPKQYERKYFSDVSILSNLAEPINAYEGGMGRGGLAWLESSPGHKVKVVVYRDGNLDKSVDLNSEIAGAVSIRKASGESLYWIDQGEEFLPVILLKTSDGLVYQVDLEDSEDFTMLPSDGEVIDLNVWSAQRDVDDDEVAFVLPVTTDGEANQPYLLTRRWEGAYLRYLWEPLRAVQ